MARKYSKGAEQLTALQGLITLLVLAIVSVMSMMLFWNGSTRRQMRHRNEKDIYAELDRADAIGVVIIAIAGVLLGAAFGFGAFGLAWWLAP